MRAQLIRSLFRIAFIIIIIIITFCVFIAELAVSRIAQHQEHVESAGRFHRLVVPRLHMRPQSVAVEQSASRARGDPPPHCGTDPVPLQFAQLAQIAIPGYNANQTSGQRQRQVV